MKSRSLNGLEKTGIKFFDSKFPAWIRTDPVPVFKLATVRVFGAGIVRTNWIRFVGYLSSAGFNIIRTDSTFHPRRIWLNTVRHYYSFFLFSSALAIRFNCIIIISVQMPNIKTKAIAPKKAPIPYLPSSHILVL